MLGTDGDKIWINIGFFDLKRQFCEDCEIFVEAIELAMTF